MHIGIALQRPLIAFFGPTSDAEIDLFGLGEKIVTPLSCSRCYLADCDVKDKRLSSVGAATTSGLLAVLTMRVLREALAGPPVIMTPTCNSSASLRASCAVCFSPQLLNRQREPAPVLRATTGFPKSPRPCIHWCAHPYSRAGMERLGRSMGGGSARPA